MPVSGISLAFYLAVEVQRSHWAGKVPGWGPAVRTELGRSQVEVQRCALSWEGPRLRSSGAHWAGKVPGWGPAVRTELGRVPGWGPAVRTELSSGAHWAWEGPRLRSSGAHWAGSQVEVQQCALSWEVGEELGEELARRKWRRELMQTWSRRNWRRRRRRRRNWRRRRRRLRRRRRTTALVRSNNPHLAGGEKWKNWFGVENGSPPVCFLAVANRQELNPSTCAAIPKDPNQGFPTLQQDAASGHICGRVTLVTLVHPKIARIFCRVSYAHKAWHFVGSEPSP